MRILLITTHLNIGGVGVYTVNLAKYLKKKGVNVFVASSGGGLEGELRENNIVHKFLDIKTKAEFGIKVFRAVPILADFIKKENIELIHAQTRVSQTISCFAGALTNVPFVSTCHGFFKHRKLARRLFPCWGERVISISKGVRRHLINDFHLEKDRIDLVYNGIEIESYVKHDFSAGSLSVREELGIEEKEIVIGAIGRLSSVKGFGYLVEAFAGISLSREKKVRLVIIGEGGEKSGLLHRADLLGVRDKILILPGKRPLERYYSFIDIFCLPSINEGLGLSLMEAMASGRACIASDVGGISELITDGVDGVLVKPADVEALKTAILCLAKDSSLREKFSQNAQKKAFNNFSIEESVDKTIEVYEKVINNRLPVGV
ncbi:MAG: glycosyltransferase family 4 protein [Candidatus Omnitrophota bacterium]